MDGKRVDSIHFYLAILYEQPKTWSSLFMKEILIVEKYFCVQLCVVVS